MSYPTAEKWKEGMPTFVTIRDRESLSELAKAYDLMNTSIYQQLNNRHTLTFNILPYENVWRIGYPNILEIDNDYYQVRRVEKLRNKTLMMTVDCEHASYELNHVPSEEEDDEFVGITHIGTASEIISEIIAGTRFKIGNVNFPGTFEFTTDVRGLRSRINAFAEEIGAEVRFHKFDVHMTSRLGTDKGLTLEVGKNIMEMREIATTDMSGRISKSYEVGLIDLSKILDDEGNPETSQTIELGDMISLKDEQFGIDRKIRVVSVDCNPFQKALPIVEIDNVVSTVEGEINTGVKGEIALSPYRMEFESAPLSDGFLFPFSMVYENVNSVTLSLSHVKIEENEEPMPDPHVYYSLSQNDDGKYDGVVIHVDGKFAPGMIVSLQAICEMKPMNLEGGEVNG